MRPQTTDPIRGKTILFTFHDGPMMGKTFEHSFTEDGKVTYRAIDLDPAVDDDAPPPSRPVKYEVERVNDEVYAVAYLGTAGYTLTTILDFETGRLTGFASNERSLAVQHGRFEARA